MKTVRSRDATSIAFDEDGAGPALILVGGAFSTRAAFAPVSTLLAEKFTVLGYDRRGRGDSGDAPIYTVQREIDDIAALIDHAGGQAFVFGHSSGAALALEAAARGLAIEKLAVYEPPFIVDDGREPVPDTVATLLATLISSGDRGAAVDAFMTLVIGVPDAALAGMRAAPDRPAMEGLAHTVVYDMAILGERMSGRPLDAGSFASIRQPTLVLGGGLSPAWMQASLRAVTAVLPDARLRILDGQAHGAAPEILAPALIDFFAARD